MRWDLVIQIPERDGEVKPRVSPRTRGLRERKRREPSKRVTVRHNYKTNSSSSDTLAVGLIVWIRVNRGPPPASLVCNLTSDDLHGFADSPVALCLHPFRVESTYPVTPEEGRSKNNCRVTESCGYSFVADNTRSTGESRYLIALGTSLTSSWSPSTSSTRISEKPPSSRSWMCSSTE